MPEDPIVAEAFSPLLSWAERTGRIHSTERRTILEAAARNPTAAEQEVRGRQLGLHRPSAQELPAPGMVAHRVTSGQVAAQLAQGRRVAAAAALPGQTGYGARPDPDSMDALLAEAASTPPPGRQPTLFPEGDLPSFTASGIPPQVLNQVPWQARPAMARATTTAAAYQMLAKYTGETGASEAEYDAMPGGPLHADVVEYSRAYERWSGGFGS